MGKAIFEITNDEEAQSAINDINADLLKIPNMSKEDTLMILKDIKESIRDLIDHYNW